MRSALAAVLMVCVAVLSGSSIAGNIENADQIRDFVRPFKTYTREPLPVLLARYGLFIRNIDSTPVESMFKGVRKPGDRDGDIVTSMHISGLPKPMPCGLHKWLSQGDARGQAEDLAEIMVRRGRFLTEEADLHPLLYWAATGKCSTAFGLPL